MNSPSKVFHVVHLRHRKVQSTPEGISRTMTYADIISAHRTLEGAQKRYDTIAQDLGADSFGRLKDGWLAIDNEEGTRLED